MSSDVIAMVCPFRLVCMVGKFMRLVTCVLFGVFDLSTVLAILAMFNSVRAGRNFRTREFAVRNYTVSTTIYTRKATIL